MPNCAREGCAKDAISDVKGARCEEHSICSYNRSYGKCTNEVHVKDGRVLSRCSEHHEAAAEQSRKSYESSERGQNRKRKREELIANCPLPPPSSLLPPSSSFLPPLSSILPHPSSLLHPPSSLFLPTSSIQPLPSLFSPPSSLLPLPSYLVLPSSQVKLHKHEITLKEEDLESLKNGKTIVIVGLELTIRSAPFPPLMTSAE